MASCRDLGWPRHPLPDFAEPAGPLYFERFRLLVRQLELFRFSAEEHRLALRLPYDAPWEYNAPLC